jgi:hypothetical protein
LLDCAANATKARLEIRQHKHAVAANCWCRGRLLKTVVTARTVMSLL